MSQGATESGQESGQQANQAGQGQEPPANGQQGQEPQSGQQGHSQEFDLNTIQDPALRTYLERVQRDAQEARQEAARYRTERNQFQAQVTEHQRAQETEQERLAREAQERQERLDRLEQENRDLKVGTALREAAEKAKAFNPATVQGLLASRVELDDQGQPTNIADLLADLRKTDAYLFKRADADAGAGNGDGGAAPSGDMNDTIRAMAGRRGRA